ncbi:hypothetical protein FHR86_003785 [Paenarthrobacter ilicis]|uniref:Uncharacterized protein n=1 Tax=Paenarthrobacter ilicis TaxID=43665 RepID=A0ABX0TQG4_9MICC|nr:hypothetical protein [Paenarthrobacter ilicis]NIJ03426.1 hypothetical protein [Paenarthrobacter ilicis]
MTSAIDYGAAHQNIIDSLEDRAGLTQSGDGIHHSVFFQIFDKAGILFPLSLKF